MLKEYNAYFMGKNIFPGDTINSRFTYPSKVKWDLGRGKMGYSAGKMV